MSLLELDRSTSFFDFGFDLFGFFFGKAFLEGRRNAFDHLLGVHQRSAGQVLDDLDHVQRQAPSTVARGLGWGPSPLDAVPLLLDRLAGFPPCVQWLFRAAIEEEAVSIGDVAETCGVSTEAVRRMLQPADDDDDGVDLAYERYAIG